MAREPSTGNIGIADVLGFLIGRREAILRLSRSHHVVWIGLLFVFSAACAREYDAEYILWRPWIMLVPLAASLLSSLLLWTVLWSVTWKRAKQHFSWHRNYLGFLGLFWMTAPMAWLYAIPYERFLSPMDAMHANYWSLGLVSAWRVWLMIRVAQVWLGRSAWGASLLVLWYGATVAIAALILSPWPIINIMSGNNDPVAKAEHSLRAMVLGLSAGAWPVLLLLMAARELKSTTPRLPAWLKEAPPVLKAGPSLWALAAVSVLVWLPVMAFTQPPLKDLPTPDEQRRLEQQRLREAWEREFAPDHQPE